MVGQVTVDLTQRWFCNFNLFFVGVDVSHRGLSPPLRLIISPRLNDYPITGRRNSSPASSTGNAAITQASQLQKVRLPMRRLLVYGVPLHPAALETSSKGMSDPVLGCKPLRKRRNGPGADRGLRQVAAKPHRRRSE